MDHGQLSMIADKFQWVFSESLLNAHRSLILETCSKIWKFSLQRENDVEV